MDEEENRISGKNRKLLLVLLVVGFAGLIVDQQLRHLVPLVSQELHLRTNWLDKANESLGGCWRAGMTGLE
ncbi:MAG: hypothetical protein ACPGVU_15450 [Limisphaerales bacterium]